jgi:hypothetical protein
MNTRIFPIALVNPPLANITQPFVALAALQGQLQGFFNVTQYERAMAKIGDAFAAISARFFPQHLSHTSYVASLVEDRGWEGTCILANPSCA